MRTKLHTRYRYILVEFAGISCCCRCYFRQNQSVLYMTKTYDCLCFRCVSHLEERNASFGMGLEGFTKEELEVNYIELAQKSAVARLESVKLYRDSEKKNRWLYDEDYEGNYS